jgi:putative SOS response-associated peptidase YedK
MCGRYTLKTPKAELDEHFGVELPELHRFNIAPSQPVPAICADAVKILKWGFVPGWSKEPTVKFSNINARCETVATSSAYRGSFRHKRCLMPADGFYEWALGLPKVPHHFRLKDGGPFAFAGIWDSWHDELETCALITTTANKVVEVAHGRMPVILQREDYQAWLDPKATPDELMGLLKPLPPELMMGYPVGKAVNSPKYDGPECVVAV